MRFFILFALIFGFIAACAFGQDEAEPTDSDDVGSSTFESSVAESTVLESTVLESTVLESTVLESTASMASTDQVTATSADAGITTDQSDVLINDFFSAQAAVASLAQQSANMAPSAYSPAFSSVAAGVTSAVYAISSDIAWNMGPAARTSVLSELSAIESSLSANPVQSAGIAYAFTVIGLDWKSLTSMYADEIRGATATPPSGSKPANATAAAATTKTKDHDDGNASKSGSTNTSGGMAPATAFPYAAVGVGFLLVGWL